MADSRYAGEAGLQAVFGQIKAAMAEKQDKVNGMVLSHNDYSDAEKQKNAQNASDIVSLNSDIDNIIEKMDGDATVYPYADVITIPDAVPANVADCSVKIEPVQDLHGYDKPWVGGAGKNKLPLVLADIKAANTVGTWSGNDYTIDGVTFTILTDDGNNVIGFKANGQNTGGENITFNLCSLSDLLKAGKSYILNGCNGGTLETYFINIYKRDVQSYIGAWNGDSSVFTAEQDINCVGRIVIMSGVSVINQMFYPMLRLSTETDATFAPYTNICPITGHTEASVQRDGKNMIPPMESGSYYVGTGGIQEDQRRARTDFKYLNPGTYTFSASTTQSKTINVGFSTWKNDSHITNERKTDSGWQTVPYTFTVSNGEYCALIIRYADDTNVDVNDIKAMLEKGSPATSYEPYVEPHTYTIALGDTIYGGTVDFDTGKVRVTHGIVDLGDLEWTYVASWHDVNLFYVGRGTLDNLNMKVTGRNALCSNYPIVSNFDFGDDRMYINSTNISNDGNIGISDTAYTDATAFKTAMDGVQLCYELATPFTIQLTPQQIQLLKGTNTITASTGQISVTVNGLSGSIGAVQEQVNDIAEDVADVQSGLSNKIGYIRIDVSGTEITNQENGWYYANISLSMLPSGAVPISVYFDGGWDVDVFYSINMNAVVARCLTSKTIGTNNRYIKVLYYIP